MTLTLTPLLRPTGATPAEARQHQRAAIVQARRLLFFARLARLRAGLHFLTQPLSHGGMVAGETPAQVRPGLVAAAEGHGPESAH